MKSFLTALALVALASVAFAANELTTRAEAVCVPAAVVQAWS